VTDDRHADPGAHEALGVPRSWSIDTYEQLEGYQALRHAFTAQPDQLIQLVKDSGLRGRGGAGFPTGMKWSFIPQGATGPGAKPKYLVINADEGEPGTCKDIPTMMADPHSLVEGCIITSYAIRANFCAIYIRGEALHPIRRVRHAVEEAYAQGYLGKDILGSGFDLDIVGARRLRRVHLRRGDGLLDSLEGRRGQPRLKPPFPGHLRSLRLAHRGEQRRDDRLGSRHRAGRRGVVPLDGLGEEPRPEDLLGVRARRAPRPVRGPAGHHAAPAPGAGRAG
jgi:NADH:ubiquinone oxidoreductase subunit F (NADH-binding)